MKKLLKYLINKFKYIFSIYFSLLTVNSFFSIFNLDQLIYNLYSIVFYCFSSMTDLEKNKKSKNEKLLKKTALAFTFATSITNISINFDILSQPIYGKYVLQKNSFKENNNFEEIVETENQNNINEICADVLMKGLNDNPYLTNKEKKILKPVKQFFLDTEFLNYDKTYYDLNTFTIKNNFLTKIIGNIYNDKNNPEYITTSAITIKYKINNTDIKYINIFKNEEENSIYGHELFHIIGNFDNPFFNEGMTSLLTEEYFLEDKQNDDAYFTQRIVTKIIIEIIGSDNMLNAYSNDNFSLVKEKLNSINNNPELTDEFLDYLSSNKNIYTEKDIDKILKYLSHYVNYLDKNTQENILNYAVSLYKNEENDNNFYYNSKYKNTVTQEINNNKVLKKAN